MLFFFRLALALGEPDLDSLAERMTLRDVARWAAYWRVEPFGDDWRRTGRAALLTRGAKPELEEMFLPSYRAPEQTIDDIRSELAKIPAFKKQMEEAECRRSSEK